MKKTIVGLLVLFASSSALAGGMFFTPRGARGLGRAGAFTAGVDDAGAIYYNPAGLVDVKDWSFLIDGALVLQHQTYDRVDSGGNAQPRVNGAMDLLPIPTIALSWRPRQIAGHWFAAAIGVWTPYLGLDTFPETGPQRYSIITQKGSLISVVELAASFKVREWLWIGVGFQNLIGHFRTRVTLSSCTQMNCAPEDPGFDSLTQNETDAGFTPSGNVGMILAFGKLRAGLNLQLPFWVRSGGKVNSRLPSDPFFSKAEIHGDAVSFDFEFPLTLRGGVEVRPRPWLRLEIDLDYEAWSMQKDFRITPHNVYISGTPGIGTYYLHQTNIVRGLNDTFGVFLGAEILAVKMSAGGQYFRFGWALETDATPNETASVLTADGLRNYLCIGVGLKAGPVRLDGGYAHVFFNDRSVDYATSRSLQLNPIQPSPAVGVGGGKYYTSADILTAGLEARW